MIKIIKEILTRRVHIDRLDYVKYKILLKYIIV